MTRRGLVALLLAFGLIAAACGGDSDSADSDSADSDGAGSDGAGSDDSGEGASGEGSAGEDGPAPEVEIDPSECPLGAHTDADGPVEVLMWHSLIAKPQEALQSVADSFNASQDEIQVRLESQGASVDEVLTKYTSAIASGDLPDLVVMGDTATLLMRDSETILPAAACFAADESVSIEDTTDIAREYYTVDGALLPGSALIASALVYFNADHFTEAGLDPADPPSTLDEMRAAAEALVEANVGEEPYTPFVLKLDPFMMEFLLTGNGSPMVDADNGRGGVPSASAFDNEGSRELYQWLVDMQADGLLDPVTDAGGALDHYLAMAAGKSSFSLESSLSATSVVAFVAGEAVGDTGGVDVGEAEEATGLNVAAGPLPGIAEGSSSQMGGAAVYMTNTGSAETQAGSWEFIKYLNEVPQQALMLTEGSFLPFNPAAMEDPSVVAAVEDDLAGQWLGISWDQVSSLDEDFPGPLIGPYADVRSAVRSGLESLILEGSSVDEAVTDTDAEITAAVEDYASF